MSTRAFVAALIFLALVSSVAISLITGAWYEAEYYSPGTADLPGFIAWATGPFSFDTAISLVSGIIISLVFFVIINAFIVRPLRAIRRALDAYAKRSERIVLPSFSYSPSEVRDLAQDFQAFANRVEEAHARDVEISRVKSDFISTAAHQLRTPLTGIRWALEALEKEPLSESQHALVKSAVDKSHDLVGIVGTLLDITSIESGKYAYHFKRSDIQSLIEEVAKDFAPLATEAGVSFRYEPGPKPIPVSIDDDRMKWTLNNLVENAIRYTPSGGSVRLMSEAVAGRAIIRVRDTGIGIKQQDRNNIFERFYRAGNAIDKENQGNGLGLYIARAIVNDHRGELSFEQNQEGPGTTFVLALPLAPQAG